MGDKFLGGIRRISGVLSGILHLLPVFQELGFRNSDGVAKFGGVEIADVLGDNHDVVGGLVENHETPLTVVDESAGRIYHTAQECVAFGILLIFVIADLKGKEADEIYDHDEAYKTRDNESAFGKVIVFTHDLEIIRQSMASKIMNVKMQLEAVRITISLTSAKLKYSMVNARRQ